MGHYWKYVLFIFCLVVSSKLGNGEATKSFLNPYPPGKRPYNLQEVKVIDDFIHQALGPDGRSLSGVEKPECWLEDFVAACCIQTNYRSGEIKNGKEIKSKHRTCLQAGIDFSALKAFVRLHHDGQAIGPEIAYSFGKFCIPLPKPLEMLDACVWIWHVNVSFTDKFAEICVIVSLTDFFHVRFDCIAWKNGTFQLFDKKPPEEVQALFTLHIGARDIDFTVKNSFKKLWLKIEEGWKIFKEKVKGLFHKKKQVRDFISKIQ